VNGITGEEAVRRGGDLLDEPLGAEHRGERI